MHMKEYRICMPLSVEEYHIGQLYMIAKHSHEQSGNGEGVAVIKNEPCDHPEHGKGQYTEKHIYLSRLFKNVYVAVYQAGWLLGYQIFFTSLKKHGIFIHIQSQCTFLPRFSIAIDTRYADDDGTTENILGLSSDELAHREVDVVDIVSDELAEKHYKSEEDLTKFKSKKTARGPLDADWKKSASPIMCSYKLVRAKFELFGLQTRVESSVHNAIREILLLGHRQAFAWIDEWYGMSMEDIRKYESHMQAETNKKVVTEEQAPVVVTPPLEGVTQDNFCPFTPVNTPIDRRPPVSFFPPNGSNNSTT